MSANHGDGGREMTIDELEDAAKRDPCEERRIRRIYAERDYWQNVGRVMGPDFTLYGWNGMSSADFIVTKDGRCVEIIGLIADRLIALDKAASEAGK